MLFGPTRLRFPPAPAAAAPSTAHPVPPFLAHLRAGSARRTGGVGTWVGGGGSEFRLTLRLLRPLPATPRASGRNRLATRNFQRSFCPRARGCGGAGGEAVGRGCGAEAKGMHRVACPAPCVATAHRESPNSRSPNPLRGPCGWAEGGGDGGRWGRGRGDEHVRHCLYHRAIARCGSPPCAVGYCFRAVCCGRVRPGGERRRRRSQRR